MKVLILSSNDVGLYKFRKELLSELIFPGSYIEGRVTQPCEIYIALPYGDFVYELVGMGCKFIGTSFDHYGTNLIKV